MSSDEHPTLKKIDGPQSVPTVTLLQDDMPGEHVLGPDGIPFVHGFQYKSGRLSIQGPYYSGRREVKADVAGVLRSVPFNDIVAIPIETTEFYFGRIFHSITGASPTQEQYSELWIDVKKGFQSSILNSDPVLRRLGIDVPPFEVLLFHVPQLREGVKIDWTAVASAAKIEISRFRGES